MPRYGERTAHSVTFSNLLIVRVSVRRDRLPLEARDLVRKFRFMGLPQPVGIVTQETDDKPPATCSIVISCVFTQKSACLMFYEVARQ